MRSEVGDTSNGIALNFNVGAEHLTDKRLKTTKLDNEQFIVG